MQRTLRTSLLNGLNVTFTSLAYSGRGGEGQQSGGCSWRGRGGGGSFTRKWAQAIPFHAIQIEIIACGQLGILTRMAWPYITTSARLAPHAQPPIHMHRTPKPPTSLQRCVLEEREALHLLLHRQLVALAAAKLQRGLQESAYVWVLGGAGRCGAAGGTCGHSRESFMDTPITNSSIPQHSPTHPHPHPHAHTHTHLLLERGLPRAGRELLAALLLLEGPGETMATIRERIDLHTGGVRAL
jgi:hypothetical protein